MDGRIFGIETEFGCMVREGGGQPEEIVERVKNQAFLRERLGLIDVHARDFAFEPAKAGGFLLNGGRLYIDAVGSHEEYATPECRSVRDIVTWDRAGRVLLQRLLDACDLDERASFHNNSIDHFAGHTFGCHENYLVDISDYYFREALAFLLPFLVTRQIFAGVGRVGGHRLNHTDFQKNVMTFSDHEVDYIWVHDFYGVELDDTVEFQLSQRADHIVKVISSRVRFNRAIINPKRDSYYDFSNMQRLHMLFGESNMMETATALKIGTTSLVLDLIEERAVPPEVQISRPLPALKSVSRDPTWRWLVDRASGGTIGAVDLQRIYLAAAKERLAGRDSETDWLLREWETVLNGLESDPMKLADRLDWVAKRKMLEEFMAAEDVSWGDDILHSLDLEYHNLNPRTGLYYGLEEEGLVRRVTADPMVERALEEPPATTRAAGRGRVIRALLDGGARSYIIDWDGVVVGKDRLLELRNPFHSYAAEAEKFAGRL